MAKKKNKERDDGRLQSKVYLGNGKYKYVYAHTQKELDEKIFDIKIKLRKGIDVSFENDKFEYWAEQWIKLKKVEVSNARYTTYKSFLKKVTPLYNYKISKITTAELQNIIIDNIELSESSLIQIRSILKQIMELAIDNRIIDYNPAARIKIPKKQKEVDRRALTSEEQQWIIDTTDYMQLPAMIMMYAGLRRGEMIPLLWSDVNLKEKTITINKSVEMIGGVPKVKSSTKTNAGMRVIYIPQILADYLSEYPRTNSMLVCPSPQGKMLALKTWNRKWHDYLSVLNCKYGNFENIIGLDIKRDELPMIITPFTAHWLRHTFITLMYMAGVDVLTAKQQAGHSDIRTTMSIYTHLDSQYKEKTMNKLDKFISDGCHLGVKSVGK